MLTAKGKFYIIKITLINRLKLPMKGNENMKYIIDNDLHIHSQLYLCSKDPEQNKENILSYAEKTGLKTICLTDHFWDEAVEPPSRWYERQNYEHITEAKPLPQGKDVKFLFGCEADLSKDLTLGVAREKFDSFDFIIIPTTHLHMMGFTISEEEGKTPEGRANAWIKRLEGVLNMDLPFHKIGLAHLTCALIAKPREEFLKVLNLIPDEEMERLFEKAAQLGVGIELNMCDMSFSEEEKETILRPYRIAKRCGCKFYCGSDAHTPSEFEGYKEIMERAVDLLGLTEDDKFIIKTKI